MEDAVTEVWKRCEKGIRFNRSLSPDLYSLVSANAEFFAGNQWLNMPETPAMARLPKPVFNIIKRVASLFVASLTSSPVSLVFEPLRGGAAEEAELAELATAEVAALFDKFKMDYRIREALFAAAQTGDYCAHFWFDPEAEPYGGAPGGARGELRMELVEGVNVIFGDPYTHEVESQPYILILGREDAEKLRAEALRYGPPGGEADAGDIVPDSGPAGAESGAGSGAADEGRCSYAYMYRKGKRLAPVLTDRGVELREKTTVYVTKATRTRVIYEDVDTGLTRYPVAWGNWERQRRCYHGRALVTGIIPNQIFINTMFAMVMRHLQLSGFPKTVYNAALIPKWSSEIGQAVAVKNLPPGQPLGSAAANLSPADMSAQIIAAIDKALEYTKECLGATDAQLGSARPENTSAIMVLQSASEVPLENVRAGLYEWVEDIGAILLDMMGAYYGRRTVPRVRELKTPLAPFGEPELDPETGLMRVASEKRTVEEPCDFARLKGLWFRCRADVGAGGYYSEIAAVQTLETLRREGVIDAVQYLERMPDRLVPGKAELIAELKAKLGAGA